jgi:hypothetical protein
MGVFILIRIGWGFVLILEGAEAGTWLDGGGWEMLREEGFFS